MKAICKITGAEVECWIDDGGRMSVMLGVAEKSYTLGTFKDLFSVIKPDSSKPDASLARTIDVEGTPKKVKSSFYQHLLCDLEIEIQAKEDIKYPFSQPMEDIIEAVAAKYSSQVWETIKELSPSGLKQLRATHQKRFTVKVGSAKVAMSKIFSSQLSQEALFSAGTELWLNDHVLRAIYSRAVCIAITPAIVKDVVKPKLPKMSAGERKQLLAQEAEDNLLDTLKDFDPEADLAKTFTLKNSTAFQLYFLKHMSDPKMKAIALASQKYIKQRDQQQREGIYE